MEILNNAPFKGREYNRHQQFEKIEKGLMNYAQTLMDLGHVEKLYFLPNA